MNKMTKLNIKKLQKENNKIRKDISNLLQKEFSTIDDDYQDIWKHINNLINNEILQESERGK